MCAMAAHCTALGFIDGPGEQGCVLSLPLRMAGRKASCTGSVAQGEEFLQVWRSRVSGKSFKAGQQHPFLSVPALMLRAAPCSRQAVNHGWHIGLALQGKDLSPTSSVALQRL